MLIARLVELLRRTPYFAKAWAIELRAVRGKHHNKLSNPTPSQLNQVLGASGTRLSTASLRLALLIHSVEMLDHSLTKHSDLFLYLFVAIVTRRTQSGIVRLQSILMLLVIR